MAIRYYKLFDLLNRKGMKKSDLRQILSSATVAKLSKGDYISGEAIEKICLFLHCQPGDIMEIISDIENLSDTTRVLTKDIVDPKTGKSDIEIYGEIDNINSEGEITPIITKLNN